MNKRKLVAMVGMDGSGKSANLNLMKNDKEFANTLFLWVRWEPCLLKPLYSILNKKQKTNSITLNESYCKKSSTKKKLFKSGIVRNLWLIAAVIDYTIEFRRKTKVAFKSGKNIVFDRYYLDLFIDQGINFDSSPSQIEKMIKRYSFLFPDMDETIYIRVHPQVCLERKDDIPNIDYLNVRWNIYEYLAQTFGWKIIDGEQSLEKVYNEIKKTIKEI